MKAFSTVLNIILALAVIFLFWKVYAPEKASQPKNDDAVTENLSNQEFAGVRIAYINTDSLVEKYEYHAELREKLEEKAKALEADLAQRQKALEENLTILQEQAPRLNEQQLQQAQQELMSKDQELRLYSNQKSQELAVENDKLNLAIKDDMDDILENIKEEFDLDFILSYDPSSILLAANDSYNITDIVVQRLNKKYQTSKTGGENKEE